jgi:hypothetical protein
MTKTVLGNEIKMKTEIPAQPNETESGGMNPHQTIATAAEETKKNLFPTNVIPLPSKGLFYPDEHPLSSGVVEIKYMTAKEEDILTTESYIRTGVVIDKLLQSLLVTKFDYNDLLNGDKNAIMIAARVYGYGPNYDMQVTTPSGTEQKVTVNLEELKHKEFDEDSVRAAKNPDGTVLFEYLLPLSGNSVTFKLLTVGDLASIDQKIKKHKTNVARGQRDIQLTTRMIQMIQSVNGNTDRNFIKLFVENELTAIDARSLRQFIVEIQPDVDMNIDLIDEETGDSFRTDVTFGPQFFWPDVRV